MEILNVSLSQYQCDCLEFQEYKIPCRHAICVALFFGLDPEGYISPCYSTVAYRATYAQHQGLGNNFFSVSGDDLLALEEDSTLPPLTRR